MEQEMQEVVELFMMRIEKRSRIELLGMEKTMASYLTSLLQLTKLRDNECVPHVVTPSA